MKLASQDSDRLLFETAKGDDGRGKQFVVVISVLVFPAIAALAAWRFGWWQQLAAGEQLVVAVALVATLAALLLAAVNSFPFLASLAFDPSSRQVMCVWKTLCGSQQEPCDFGEFRQVEVEIVMLSKFEFYSALRLSRARGRTIVLPMRELINLPGKEAAEALAAELRELLALAPQSREKIHASPFEERSTRGFVIVTAVILMGLGAMIVLSGAELLQVSSWPKTAGVVESFRIVKKQRRKYVTVDAVEIVYRYTVDRIVRRGRRYNGDNNMLSRGEADKVRQQYHPDGPCTVSYNPAAPARSFLKTDDANFWGWCEVGGGGLFVLLGLACIGYSVWQIAHGESALKGLVASRVFESAAGSN